MMPLYNFLTLAGSAVLVPALYVKSTRDPEARRGLRQRLGHLPPWPGREQAPSHRGGLWLQAVSVGEVRLAETFLRQIRADLPDLLLALSATTSTGLQRASALETGANGGPRGLVDAVFAFPLDIPWVVRRALTSLRPRAYGTIETEIWPGLLSACARQRISTFIVNGSLSERSARRWRWMAGAVREGLGALRAACMQSEEDAERLVRIGAPREVVEITGNMKFDSGASGSPEGSEPLRRLFPFLNERPVLIAGSTSPGEEEILLDAWRRASASVPGLALVIAPRHRERFGRVAGMLDESGERFLRRSALGDEPAPGSADVILLDSLGELEGAYCLAKVAFVGGSLVPRGGQNPLEPARQSVPVLFGPGMDTFREIAEGLVTAGGAFEVKDAVSLADRCIRLCRDDAAHARAASAARGFVQERAGATLRTIDALRRRIPEIFE
jgi:3-deoxy-D-manno-octulosonic-acid transferase